MSIHEHCWLESCYKLFPVLRRRVRSTTLAAVWKQMVVISLRGPGCSGTPQDEKTKRLFECVSSAVSRHKQTHRCGVRQQERLQRPAGYRSAEFAFLCETGPEDHI